ncbi:MAG: hypothetical protein B9S32_09070 [Verrucomicrobia bacterium Tous-C9LFEB]|nr:MAG: hypothetical protein B9S32_09070 [Verrucomicrobia bacterium Tous-C9LFEB]
MNLRNIIYGGLALTLTTAAMASEAPRFKVETGGDRSVNVISATTKQMQNQVYISGLVRIGAPYHPSVGTHVDVYLLNASGQTLAHKRDRIIVTSSKRDRTQGGQFSYAVSFDNATAGNAAVARVVSCTDTHSDPS